MSEAATLKEKFVFCLFKLELAEIIAQQCSSATVQ